MKKIIFLLITILVVSCSNFAKTHTAKPTTLQKWQSSSPELSFYESNIINQSGQWWWQKYNDQSLNQLMESALYANNQLQIAAANVDYANAQLEKIEFAWIPNLSFLTGYSSFPAMGNLGYFYGGMASYSLNVFQQLKQQKQAKYILETIQYANLRVELAVIGQVAISYYSLLAYQQELELYQKLKQDLTAIYLMNNQRFTSGVSSQKEPFVTMAEIAQIDAKIATVKHNIVLSQNALRFLTNQNPGSIVSKQKFEDVNPNLPIPINLPMTVLNNRPDVQEATTKLKAANEGIGVAQSELLPSIGLASFYRDASSSLNGTYSPADLNQLVVALPIINAQAFGDIAMQNALYKRVYYEYLQTVLFALKEVDDDISAHNKYFELLNDNNRALTNIDQSCLIENSRFTSGVSSKLEYMKCIAKDDYFRLMVVQIKLEKMLITVKLYQDLAITKL